MTDPILFSNALQRAAAQLQTGDFSGAVTVLRKLLDEAPSHPQVLFLLGSAEVQRGRTEKGVQLLRKSLDVAPNQPRALCNLGAGLHSLGRDEEAVAAYDRALAFLPGYAMAHNNRGTALLALERTEEALQSFDRAIALEPRYADAFNNRGGVLRQREAFDEALAAFDRALALNPGHAGAHCNRGMTLNDLRRPEEALQSFDRALAIDDHLAVAHCGRASALYALKRFDEARRSNDRALALDPDFAEAKWNGAMLKLMAGELAEGWELYESRWRLPEWRSRLPRHLTPARLTEHPMWNGEEKVSGKTLLVFFEQGYGDFFQFCRYVPMASALGAQVIVAARAPLLPLLVTLKGCSAAVDSQGPLPKFDLYCPVMSLPRAFKTTLAAIPAEVPYLSAEPARREAAEAKLGEKTLPRVGILWSGNLSQKADPGRHMAIQDLAPLAGRPFAFHCLQKEIKPGEEAGMAEMGIVPHRDDLRDFADTAALIACMDLIVSVDTAVAHLAGAMGRPLWLMLHWAADWRWLEGRSDSPWYPSARLIRQKTQGDWAGVIADVAGRLAAGEFS